MTPEYLAGLFDGEGCIRIEAHRGGAFFKVRCALVNTHLPTLLIVRDAFGGRLETRYVPSRPTHRQSYALCWDGTNNVRRLLDAIRPFSLIKRQEIDIVLDQFIPSINPLNRSQLTSAVILERMRERLSAIKREAWGAAA